MLDNIEGQELLDLAARLKQRWNGKRKFLLETSGGIEESNLRERAVNREISCRTVVFKSSQPLSLQEIDILSTSAVHQSVQHIDFSLKIQRALRA